MKSIILILGAPNDLNGNLSTTAIDRLNAAYELYRKDKKISFLCSGGFGEHFNTSDLPHAHYAKQYLIKMGAIENDFLPHLITSNTVDDFRKAIPVLVEVNPEVIYIVTSDFHVARAKMIFNIITQDKDISKKVVFIYAKSSHASGELKRLEEHENKAIKILINNNFTLY
ncbi:YdcF family protein [Chryseobacterium paridis]|uniref:YdcF family protein n=1 Tax=Chryseobacterium paridis TaxID=2800328 RepID=A0ABS1FVD6_9FLAO|nr:YdcF family protein [Chryseobacterium paridis]MBK1896408.1 YdcF family protein [Chryseobacterium paridis]